ncbi:MAG: caspase domain-containing protein [Hyphomicrobium sp.]
MSFLRTFVALALTLAFWSLPAQAEKRVALVVGNSKYSEATPLANPANDANEIATALKGAGFEVILGLDVDKRAFDTKVRNFAELLDGSDVAIFFYAGHGLQVGGRNYLIPTDARLANERDLDFDAVSLDLVLKQMELGRAEKTNIVFLDACRDNPFTRNLARSMGTRSSNLGKGLAQVETGVGTFISYSTQPGNVALDGTGHNSPFTAALAKHVREPGRNLTSTMIEVRKDVLAATGGKQVPWDHSALTGDFYFQQTAAKADEGTAAGARSLDDAAAKKSDAEHTQNIVALAQARERLRQLQESNKTDQQEIFDKQYETGGSGDADSRRTLSMAIGKIQMRMVRRNQEQEKLRGEISALESKLGIEAKKAEGEGK